MEISFRVLLESSFKFFRHHFLFLILLYVATVVILVGAMIISILPPTVVGSTVLSSQFQRLGLLWEQIPESSEAIYQLISTLFTILMNPMFLFGFLVFLLVVSYFSVAQVLAVLEGIKGASMGNGRIWASVWAGIRKGWEGLWIAAIILGIYLGMVIVLVLVLISVGFWVTTAMSTNSLVIVPIVLLGILIIAFVTAIIYFAILFLLAFPSFVFEEKKGWSALQHSMELTKGYRLKIFFYYLGLFLVSLLVFIPLEVGMDILDKGSQLGFPFLSFILFVADLVLQLMVLVGIAVFTVQLYWRLKMVKEKEISSS